MQDTILTDSYRLLNYASKTEAKDMCRQLVRIIDGIFAHRLRTARGREAASERYLGRPVVVKLGRKSGTPNRR